MTFAVVPGIVVDRLPTEWLHHLREGTTDNALRAVAGQGSQRWPHLLDNVLVPRFGLPTTLRGAAAVNLGAQLAASLLWFRVLLGVLGRPLPAMLLTVGPLLCRSTQVLATSEIAAPTLSLTLAAAALPADLTLRGDRSAVVRLHLLLTTLLVAVLRPELTLLSAPLWLAQAGVTLPDLLTPLRAAWPLVLGWIAVCAAFPMVVPVGPPVPNDLAYALTAWQPTNLGFLAFPAEWARHLPVGVVVLALVGVGHSLRAPTPTLALGVLLPALFGLYAVSAHQPYPGGPGLVSSWELLRYNGAVLPLIPVLAAWGWQALPTRARGAALLLCLLPPVPQAVLLLHPVEATAEGSLDLALTGPLHQDQQVEARALLSRLEAEPTCAVLTRVRDWNPARRQMRWAALSSDEGRISVRLGPPDPDLTAGLALIDPTSCYAVWRSRDCNLPGDGCAAIDALGQVPSRPSRHFLHPDHEGGYPAEMSMGWVEP